jgi:hypothetical protein
LLRELERKRRQNGPLVGPYLSLMPSC